jgi:predicted ATP-dependent serine protease
MTQSKLITIYAGTLLTTPLPPIRFIISEMLPQGLHILAGAPKIGKSWLVLMIWLRVASGEALWDFQVSRGTVLYLCLEDSFTRIQNRLFDIADDAPENLNFATMSEAIGEGLENQKEILKMPEEEWIVVDGMHEPIIDQKTWDTAQKKLTVRKRTDNQGA